MPINYEFDLLPSLLPACQYMFFISHIYPTWYHWRNLSGAWLSQAGQKKAESRAKAKWKHYKKISIFNLHFPQSLNSQKICILHCKIETFCIFSWKSLILGVSVLVSISGKWKICKKSPFYTVKWIFFAYLVAPENAYPTSLPQE